MTDYTGEVRQLMEAIDSNWKELNIMVLGLTGSGKSTLINTVFGNDAAPVGAGKPVTKGITRYKNGSLSLFDTEGVEVDYEQQKRITDEICTTIRSRSRQGVVKQIHMIWYCIDATGRIQDRELSLLKQVSQCIKEAPTEIPIIFVITKPALVDEDTFHTIYGCVRDAAAMLFPKSAENIIELQAIPASVGRGSRKVTLEPYGIEDLDCCVRKRLPETIRDTYNVYQRVNLQSKIDKANSILYKHYATAGAAIAGGSTVVGIDDTWALIAMQLAMFAEIGNLFHFTFDENKVKAALVGSLGVGVASAAGKTIAHYALAFLTGGASVAAEALVRVSIADGITLTAGKAYIALMKRFANGELSEDQVTLEIESLLKKNYGKNKA